MDGGDGGPVREWQPTAAVRSRHRRRMIAIGVAAVAVYAVVLAVTHAPPAAGAALLGSTLVFFVVAAQVRLPAARTAPAGRAPLMTDPAVAQPSSRDLPVERRGRRARAGAAVLLVLAGLYAGPDVLGAPQFTIVLGLMGLLTVDLPWLVRLRRLDRRPLSRVPLTVEAVGKPSAGRLVLSSPTAAWTAEREGVLHDAVVGDVLQADVTPRHGDPVVLTLGNARGMAPPMYTVEPEKFLTLVGRPLTGRDPGR